jgi:MFS transporter, DHA1 family, multidrug resistance protein
VRGLNYRVLAIYLITAFSFGAGGARNLAIPLYADQLGASRGEIGLLFSTFTITAALLSLPSGLLADRFGRRNMVVLSLLALGLSQLIAGLAHDIRVLFATQLLGGVGGGASQTAVMAALADLVPMERMGRSMGWLTLAMQTGFLGGPAVAGILLRWLTLQEDLLVTTIPVGFALVLTFWVSGVGGRKGVKLEVRRPLLALSAQRGFVGLVIALLAATMLWGTYNAYIPVFGKRGLGLSGPEVGYLLAFQAVINGATRVPAGRLLDRVTRKGLVVAATTAGFALGLLVLPHLHGFWIPSLLLLVTVPMIATAFIAVGIVFVQMATADSRGTAMGVYSTVLFLGLGAGPAIFAPLMDRSFVIGFSACGIAGVVLAALSLAARSEPIRRRRAAVIPPTP